MGKNYRNYIGNIILCLSSAFLTCLFLEIAMRLSLYFKNQKSFEEVMKHPPELRADEPADLAKIIRPSRCAGIIYEFRPNIKANFINVPVETNNEGWRGKLYPRQKRENSVRIVSIGDSHMFGWGVPEEKRYTNVLENMLNARFPEKKWEIINTAVPGYNTYMEVETLERKALAYNPDIVIMEYIGNDLDLPNFIADDSDYTNFNKSFLINFLKGRIGVLKTQIPHLIDAPTFIDPDTGGVRFATSDNIRNVPRKYRHMVGWYGFAKSMERLKKMQGEHNFEVVVLISHNWPKSIPQKLMTLCQSLQFHALFSPQRVEHPSLILSNDDWHPSMLGHKLTAHNLLNFLIQERIPDEYIEKK